MTVVMWRLALIALVACGSREGDAPGVARGEARASGAGGCAALGAAQFGARMVARMRADLAPASPDALRLDAHRAQLEAAIDAAMVTACTRDAWPASAATCVARATAPREIEPCALTADQTAALGAALSGALEATLPPDDACDRYLAMVRALAACDQVPATAKDAANRSAAQVRAAVELLARPDLPASTRASTLDACTRAAEVLAQVAQRCPL